MKRMFFAVMAVVILFTGCVKDHEVSKDNKVNVVFSVADKVSYGVDTKAVKQEWKVGDEIIIVFECETSDWLDPSENQNTVLLAYNGEDWYVANVDDNLINNLRTSSSYFYAVHYPGTIMLGNKGNDGKIPFVTYKGGEYLTADGEWHLQGNDLILDTINLKRRADMFQISVQDLATDQGDWTLSILNDGTSQDVDITHMNSYVGMYIHEDKVGMTAPQDHQASGVKIGDDIAFTFILDGPSENVNIFTFELSNGTDKYELDVNNINNRFQGGKAYLLPGNYSNYWNCN